MIQELGTGGAERILVSAYRGAREAGHEVFVAAAPGPLAKELDGEPYPLPLVHRKPWRVPAAALAVRRAVGATRPDVVHAHNPTMALAAGLFEGILLPGSIGHTQGYSRHGDRAAGAGMMLV